MAVGWYLVRVNGLATGAVNGSGTRELGNPNATKLPPSDLNKYSKSSIYS